MKVLLVQAKTYNPEMEGPIFPLGLSYLAGALRPRHDVRIADVNTMAGGLDELVRVARRARPDVIGYSMRNIKVSRPGVEERLTSLDPLRAPLSRLREALPGVPIIAGGCAFGLYTEVFMRRIPEIDIGVVGEGEIALPALLESLDDPGSVPGVVVRDGDALRGLGGMAERPVFAELPPPDRSGIDLDAYTSREYAVGVQTKRGCALRCLHCADLYLTGGKVRHRDPAAVVDEVELLVRERGLRSLQFVDNVFNVPMSHAHRVVEEMLRRDLRVRWTAWFTAAGLTEEFLVDARRSGLTSLQLSPDSTNDDVLRALRKPERRRDLYRAAELARGAGLPMSLSFFYPNPGESLRSSLQLVSFLARAKVRMGGLLWLHGRMVVRTRVYPHTDLQRHMIDRGLLSPDDDLVEPVYYEPEPYGTVERGIERAFKVIYDTRRVLKRAGLIRARS